MVCLSTLVPETWRIYAKTYSIEAVKITTFFTEKVALTMLLEYLHDDRSPPSFTHILHMVFL